MRPPETEHKLKLPPNRHKRGSGRGQAGRACRHRSCEKTVMGEWKAQLSLRVRQDLRREMQEFAALEGLATGSGEFSQNTSLTCRKYPVRHSSNES